MIRTDGNQPPPHNIEFVAIKRKNNLIYKLYIIVNDKIVPLHQRGEMGNHFWRDPLSDPKSPDSGDFVVSKTPGITSELDTIRVLI